MDAADDARRVAQGHAPPIHPPDGPLIREVEAPSERSRLCETILRSLPDWFGIEEANARYVRECASLPTFGAGDAGFASLKLRYPWSAELYVMGVRPELHRRGIGTALVGAAEEYLRQRGVEYLRQRGVEYLQVKTLGPSWPDAGYEGTRRFYESRGFRPLEELHELWDANPCLLLVKRL